VELLEITVGAGEIALTERDETGFAQRAFGVGRLGDDAVEYSASVSLPSCSSSWPCVNRRWNSAILAGSAVAATVDWPGCGGCGTSTTAGLGAGEGAVSGAGALVVCASAPPVINDRNTASIPAIRVFIRPWRSFTWSSRIS